MPTRPLASLTPSEDHASNPHLVDPTVLTTQQLQRESAMLRELMEASQREVGALSKMRHEIVITRLDSMDKATLLTTEQLPRELEMLRELLGASQKESAATLRLGLDVITTRLVGMDKAIELVKTDNDHMPTVLDEKIRSLRDIHEEKFLSIQTQFRERDVRTEQSSKDSKVAVDAALQAAKEAVGENNKSSAMAIAKSETATIKQIDQLIALIQAGNKAIDDKFLQTALLIQAGAKAADDKITDLKDRVTRVESKDEGKVSNVAQTQTANTFGLAVVGTVFAIILGIGAFVVSVMKH